MGLIYLAGPIEGLDYKKATRWRETAAAKLMSKGHDSLSPMRDKIELEGLSEISLVERKRYGLDTGKFSDQTTIARDRYDVFRCDVVLMNLMGDLKTRSIGTMVELGWADAYRKPVVLVYHLDNPAMTGPYLNHPFIRELVTYRTDDLNDAIEFVHFLVPPQACK